MKKIKILFSIIAVLIFLPVAANAELPFVLDKVVAVVNNEVITWSQLYQAMEFDYSRQISSLSGDEKRKFLEDHEAGYLDKMIDMTLQVQEAKRLKMDVGSKEVDDAISAIKKKYSMDDSAFEAALKSEGLTLKDYRKRLSDQILVNEVVSREVREKINVSGAQVAEYAKSKGLTAVEGDSYKLAQIFFRMPKDPGQKEVIEKRADEALQKIRSGGDFMAIAKAYSQSDPDIGVINKDMLSSSMLDVISKLKVGNVSQPFWTENGLYILKLEDESSSRRPADLENGAKQELVEAKFEHDYKLWLKGLREKSYVEIRL
ncbi:MAG: SurA N-terminal domain-containing protein [Nitrospiraceae bacterium]|nr:SurA N-terminal domain-containing protein [Nitrospiraceae bacterium]